MDDEPQQVIEMPNNPNYMDFATVNKTFNDYGNNM